MTRGLQGNVTWPSFLPEDDVSNIAPNCYAVYVCCCCRAPCQHKYTNDQTNKRKQNTLTMCATRNGVLAVTDRHCRPLPALPSFSAAQTTPLSLSQNALHTTRSIPQQADKHRSRQERVRDCDITARQLQEAYTMVR